MGKIIILFLSLGFVFYILYVQGVLIVNTKRAVMFVGSIRGKDNCRANFTSCSGYMKRVIKFKESKTYSFVLHSELEKGEIEVKILDATKQPIMTLNHIKQTAMIAVDKKRRYYLIFTFKSASGKYELKWN